jgi:hypothetical protein
MTAAVNVINCTLYRDNPYQQMLFAPLTDRYTATRGTVEDAIAARQDDARALLHVHWEEHLLRAMPTLQEARIAAGHFTRQLARYRSGGGKTIWTIHNAAPHELEHLEVFQSVRSVLAEAADRILVHTVDAVGVLAEQVALDRSKVFYLPHPSYLGIYEPVAQLEESLRRTPGRSVITFGKLRRYKGLERLLDELPPEFLRELGSSLEIRGEPLAGDDYVPELQARSAERDDVLWDTRRIGDEEVPGLLRAGAMPRDAVFALPHLRRCAALREPRRAAGRAAHSRPRGGASDSRAPLPLRPGLAKRHGAGRARRVRTGRRRVSRALRGLGRTRPALRPGAHRAAAGLGLRQPDGLTAKAGAPPRAGHHRCAAAAPGLRTALRAPCRTAPRSRRRNVRHCPIGSGR